MLINLIVVIISGRTCVLNPYTEHTKIVCIFILQLYLSEARKNMYVWLIIQHITFSHIVCYINIYMKI